MNKYFENGEQVKVVNNHGEEFDVRIINMFCDYYCNGGDGKMYYVVEPVGFQGFTRAVPCEQCYK